MGPTLTVRHERTRLPSAVQWQLLHRDHGPPLRDVRGLTHGILLAHDGPLNPGPLEYGGR